MLIAATYIYWTFILPSQAKYLMNEKTDNYSIQYCHNGKETSQLEVMFLQSFMVSYLNSNDILTRKWIRRMKLYRTFIYYKINPLVTVSKTLYLVCVFWNYSGFKSCCTLKEKATSHFTWSITTANSCKKSKLLSGVLWYIISRSFRFGSTSAINELSAHLLTIIGCFCFSHICTFKLHLFQMFNKIVDGLYLKRLLILFCPIVVFESFFKFQYMDLYGQHLVVLDNGAIKKAIDQCTDLCGGKNKLTTPRTYNQWVKMTNHYYQGIGF